MRPLFLATAAALLLVANASTAEPAARQIEVRSPWSRPAAAGAVGVGYMTLVNPGPRPAALTGVESPAAERVEMHRSAMEHGIMTMSPQARIVVPAGGSVAFAPGGYHLMFLGLKRALKPGDGLPATLVFEGGLRLSTNFAVGNGGPPDHATGDVTKK